MLQLKAIRQAAGKTQKDVADALRIARVTYTNLENGRRNPDIQTIVALADFFQVSIDTLFGRSSASNISVEAQESIESRADQYSTDEISLIASYRVLTPQGQEYIRQQMHIAVSMYKGDAGISVMESQEVS